MGMISEIQGAEAIGEAEDARKAETSIWALEPNAGLLARIFHELWRDTVTMAVPRKGNLESLSHHPFPP
jgi:hypothetical protein